MKASARSWLVMLLWLGALAALSVWLSQRTTVEADLRLFLPNAENAAERIMLAQLKEGPGTRLMLGELRLSNTTTNNALTDSQQQALAEVSAQLTDALRSNALFTRVENGSLHSDAASEQLIGSYRYLLTPDAPDFSREALHADLQDRLDELSSPAGSITQDWLLRDPTGAAETLITSWQGNNTPQLIDGVWFDTAGQRALLLLQTAAPGFDAEPQRSAIAAINTELARLDASHQFTLQLTGPGAFSALLEQSIRRDVTALSTAEGIASFVFLLLVLWSWRHVLLGSLTLASAGVAALLGVTLLFSSVHGITLAFGFTLLGVAMDYPVHLMLHLERDHSVADTVKSVWPTLRLSIFTTCIAYAALCFAGFTGLAQLGTFTIVGLLCTAVLIRWLLPHLVDVNAVRTIPSWVSHVQRAPRLRWLAVVIIAVAALALWRSPNALWNNELSGLTPVPQALQDLDGDLRKELGAPDLRYVIAITGTDTQSVLQRDESLRAGLQSLLDQQVIGNFAQPSELLPSVAAQQTRQSQLPERDVLQTTLKQAVVGLPFRDDVFDGFLNDVEQTRQLTPLQPADLAGSPLAERINATVFATDRETAALITLSDVRDPAALNAWANAQGKDVLLIDLKDTSEQLVARFRTRALLALGVALVGIAVLMLAQLPWAEALAVLLPVIATLLGEVALLNVFGVSLTLFHIVSLLLVGGLCFDYGLFFNRSEHSDSESLRTRYAVMACWLSTTGAFALLLISQLPVLKAIGSTVALGVTLGFIIALLARRDSLATQP